MIIEDCYTTQSIQNYNNPIGESLCSIRTVRWAWQSSWTWRLGDDFWDDLGMIFGMIDGSDCGIQNLKAIELPMIIVICFVFRCFFWLPLSVRCSIPLLPPGCFLGKNYSYYIDLYSLMFIQTIWMSLITTVTTGIMLNK